MTILIIFILLFILTFPILSFQNIGIIVFIDLTDLYLN